MTSFQDLGGAQYNLRANDQFSTVFKRLREEFDKTEKAFADMQGTLVGLAAAAKQINIASQAEKNTAAAQKQTQAVKALHDSIKKRASDDKKIAADEIKSNNERIRSLQATVKQQQANEALRARITRAERQAASERANAAATATKNQGIFNSLLGESVEGGNKLLFTFRRLFGVLAAFTIARELASGLKNAVLSAISLNAQLEQVQVSITGTIAQLSEYTNAQGEVVAGQEAITLASEDSRKQLALLRNDAVRIGTSFAELAENFQIALGQAIPAGLGLDEIRKFTVLVSQAAQKVGVAQNQLAEEIRALLIPGAATARTSRIFTTFGFSREQIENARATNKLSELFERRLGVLAQTSDLASQRFTLLIARVKEFGNVLITNASASFFATVKDALIDLSNVLVKVKTDSNGVFQGFIPNPAIQKSLKEIFDFLSGAVDRARAFILGLDLKTVEKNTGGVVAVLKVVQDIVFAIAKTVGVVGRTVATLSTIFGPILSGLSPILGALIQVRTTILLLLLTGKGLGGLFTGFIKTSLLAKASIVQLAAQFGIMTKAARQAQVAATAAAAAAASANRASTGAATGGLLGLVGRIGGLFSAIVPGVALALTAIDVVSSFIDSDPVGARSAALDQDLDKVKSEADRLNEEAKRTAEEISETIRASFVSSLEGKVQARALTIGLSLALKEVLQQAEDEQQGKIDELLASKRKIEARFGGRLPEDTFTKKVLEANDPALKELNNEITLINAEIDQALRNLEIIQARRTQITRAPRPVPVDLTAQSEAILGQQENRLTETRLDLENRILSIKRQQLEPGVESRAIARAELESLIDQEAAARNIARIKADQARSEKQTAARQLDTNPKGEADQALAREQEEIIAKQEKLAVADETLKVEQKRLQIAQQLREVEGTLGEGLAVGLRDLGAQMASAFNAGRQLIQTGVQQLSSFISGEFAAAFDPSNDTTFRERFGKFLQGLANSIISTLTNLGIGALLGELFPANENPAADAAKQASQISTATQVAGIQTTAAATSAGTITAAGSTAGAAIAAGCTTGAAAIDAAAARLAAAAAGAGVAGAGAGAAWTGGVIGMARGGKVPRRGRPSTQHLGLGMRRPKGLHPSDKVPIWAALGEFMQPVKAVATYGVDLFEAFRRGQIDVQAARALLDGNSFAPKVVRARSMRVSGMATGGGVGTAPRGGTTGGPGGSQLVVLPVLVSDKQNVDRFINSDGGKEAMFDQARTTSTTHSVLAASRNP